MIHIPAKDAYVIPTGIVFITLDKEYIHNTIVRILNMEGISFVNPSELFAKVFDAVPNTTAANKKTYANKIFIYYL